MPGASHIFYGAALGLLLYFLTKGRFSGRHIIILTINSYIGPDLGLAIGSLIGVFPGGEGFEDAAKSFLHDPFGFLVLAAGLAVIYTLLTRLGIRKGGPLGTSFYWHNDGRRLYYFDCFQVIAAGGFSHFLLDNLFHPGTNWYLWVIGTGDWAEYTDWMLLAPVLGTFAIGIIFLGFYMILFSSVVQNSKYIALKFKILTVIGFAVSVSVYILFFMLFGPTHSGYPAVAEEADLGIIIFLSIFLFLPLILCINSYQRYGSQRYALIHRFYSL